MEFTKRDAEALLAPCGLSQYLEVEADGGDRPVGIWPAVGCDSSMIAENDMFGWRPVQVFADDSGWPEMAALPFPFTGKHLAAFMLEGVGAQVADYYGGWEDGPDPDSLAQIPVRDFRARTAVKAAFDAYREAIQRVGARDDSLDEKAEVLRRKYRDIRSVALARERISEVPLAHSGDNGARMKEEREEYRHRLAKALKPLNELKEEMRLARAAAIAAHQAWLKAMVSEFLKPATEHRAPHTGAPVPVELSMRTSTSMPRKTRKTWRDAVWPYLVRVQREGGYRSCKDLFNALEAKGVERDAPITKGFGEKHRGRLFIVEINQSIELKTFQNAWLEILEAAKH